MRSPRLVVAAGIPALSVGGLDGPPLVLSARGAANLSLARELCGDLTVGNRVISRASVDPK